MALRQGLFFASFALAMIVPGAASAAGSAERSELPAAIAILDISHGSGGLTIRGGALALTDGEFQANMVIDTEGASGSMKTSQGGKLSLKAGESGNVARVGLSWQPGDRIDIRLDISAGGEPVSATRTVVK